MRRRSPKFGCVAGLGDSLATALYVTTDDLLKESPHLAPWRPAVGIAPQLTDAELTTLAMMRAVLGFTSEADGSATPALTCGTCFPYWADIEVPLR